MLLIISFFSLGCVREKNEIEMTKRYVYENNESLKEISEEIKKLKSNLGVIYVEKIQRKDYYKVYAKNDSVEGVFRFDSNGKDIGTKNSQTAFIDIIKQIDDCGIQKISITGQGVEIFNSSYGNLYSTSYKTILSDFDGEVPVEKLIENYKGTSQNEWAYKLNEDWLLVNLKSNL